MNNDALCDKAKCFYCKFPMGAEVVDSVTGFCGTVTGYAKFMGCDDIEILLTPASVDNILEPELWFSESRLITEDA